MRRTLGAASVVGEDVGFRGGERGESGASSGDEVGRHVDDDIIQVFITTVPVK